MSTKPSKSVSSVSPTSAPATRRILPIGDRVLIHFPKQGETIKGGIVVLESATQSGSTIEGKVVDVGGLVKGITVGDTVIVPQYTGSEIKIEGERYAVVATEDILAIIG